TWAGGARYEARVNRLVLPLLLLAACNVSAGGEPPQPVKIASFEASPAQVAAGGDVALTWSISGPVQRLVIAAGGCACELDVSATSFTDSCGSPACDCPCATQAPGEVLYSLTAIGPAADGTGDTATRAVFV